ncbi:MAG: hypothetical protein HYW70_03140 [Candidatus Nealsonbacteria bacterium]|nr:hypothetical protein [Candidatus Nealsonbacteria bacterium]
MIKIALVVDKRDSKFGFAISSFLKKRYDVKLYDIGCLKKDEDFFKLQKELDYEPLIVKEELDNKVKKEAVNLSYLKVLEEKYGNPNLWPYVWADRYIMGQYPKYEYSFPGPGIPHEEILKRLQVCFREISKAFEEKKPDWIIFPTLGSLESVVLYGLAKKTGIKILYFDFPRIKNTMLFTDNCFNQFTQVYQIFDSIRKGERQSQFREKAVSFLKEFREKPYLHRYFIPQKQKTSFLKRIVLSVIYFWRFRKRRSPHNYSDYLKNRFTRIFRKLRGIKGIFEEPKEGEDFAYFPLHYEPETATMLYAPFHTHQIALIQNIAKSLPINFKLYVKEHFSMLYYRPFSYYEELKKIPNVRLINPAVDSVSLAKKSKLVLTITGTAGWEAILLSKPVITFGQVFYNKLSRVTNCQRLEDLPQTIKESLEKPPVSEEELIDFLSAIFEKSIRFDYAYFWETASFKEIEESEDFKNFVVFLAKELNLKPVSYF